LVYPIQHMKKVRPFLIAVAALFTIGYTLHAEGIPSKGYALFAKDGNFQPYEFERHAVGEHDVLIDIYYAGICHSDIHHVHEDWGPSHYPQVPGHEIIGGIPETQEMLDYSVAQNLYPDVEVISVDQIDEAYRKVLEGDVKFRYVIDMRTME